MNSNSDNRLEQKQRRAPGDHTPTGVRLKMRKASEEELVGISPAFRIIEQHPPPPTPAQWRDFSRKLATRIEYEAQKKSGFRSIQVIRDKFTATDSVALRVTGYALLVLALSAIAFGLWLAAGLVFTSAPETSGAMTRVAQPAVACAHVAVITQTII
jgi:hypothetical protein